MINYDVIVIGGGLTGSALSYELSQKKLKVLLIEKDPVLNNATIYSYGGISYWGGTSNLTNQLCQEGINIHRNLEEELSANTEFREIDLLFTIDIDQNPQETLEDYKHFFIQPQLLDIDESLALEPLLNKNNITGCLRFSQGHVNPQKTILAYQKSLENNGGNVVQETVISLTQKEDKIIGIKTNNKNYFTNEVIICAGAFSRQILQDLGLNLPIYFTHAQLFKTPPSDIKLRTLVMPATTKRFEMEKQATSLEIESIWQTSNNFIQNDVLEAGAIQFLDGSFCLGQISQIITNIGAPVPKNTSERRIREAIAKTLPSLANIEGTWHNCQIAFSQGMPFQVGKIKKIEGLSIFSGFTSPFVFVPPLAKHFAHYLTENSDPIIESLPSL
ncbi:NAD(P)/FAD-dependent oxidoreductase [Geminocystis sp.]|uniref:NAD(P)/FAD-dependent oxidoreductase n=1 Tax=Geminocystis sp. TaxID=2664100 RepID=UPI0035940473